MPKPILTFAVFGSAAMAACHSQPVDQSFAVKKQFESAVTAAQVEAKRPADASLSCKALEKEFNLLMTDPVIQSYITKSAREAEKYQNAQSPDGQLAPSIRTSPYPSALQRADAMQHMQKQMQLTSEIMPQLAREQRLMELSAERNCSWAGLANGNTANLADIRH